MRICHRNRDPKVKSSSSTRQALVREPFGNDAQTSLRILTADPELPPLPEPLDDRETAVPGQGTAGS